jgi:hypothetical protein
MKGVVFGLYRSNHATRSCTHYTDILQILSNNHGKLCEMLDDLDAKLSLYIFSFAVHMVEYPEVGLASP